MILLRLKDNMIIFINLKYTTDFLIKIALAKYKTPFLYYVRIKYNEIIQFYNFKYHSLT
jgi:hypothetical protein